jgi:hypothetical protein
MSPKARARIEKPISYLSALVMETTNMKEPDNIRKIERYFISLSTLSTLFLLHPYKYNYIIIY